MTTSEILNALYGEYLDSGYDCFASYIVEHYEDIIRRQAERIDDLLHILKKPPVRTPN